MVEQFVELVGLAALVSGLGYIGWIAYLQWLVAKSQSWPATGGTIVSSQISRNTSLVGPSHTPNRTFSAQIEYQYRVGAEPYTGSKICIGGELNTSFAGRAENRVQKYPPGSTVRVYYDPANPQTSCLERRGETAAFGYLIGGACTLIGLLILLDVIRFGG